jgi:plastocyanin
MKCLSRCPAWKRRALILMGALSVLLAVGVFAASCGGGTTTTTATTPTTVGPATTAGTPTTAGTGGTAGTSTTVVASTTAGTPTSAAGGGGAQVVMKGFAFDPASVTIKVGESVTWTNQDPTNHTVTADKGEFKSSDIANGATFTFKFDTAGTYAYHCSIHPSMTGTVVVQ